MKHNVKRLRFENTKNVRDFGGYETDNSVTQFGVFLRSDCLSGLKEDEIQRFKDLNLSDVIDLRFKDELEAAKNPFTNDKDVNYHHISVSDGLVEGVVLSNQTLGEMYIEFGSNKVFIKNVFEALGNAEGMALFHCSAGKDRTGIIAALILSYIGVQKKDVLADYQVSSTYLFEKTIPNEFIHFMKSQPEDMATFLDYIVETHGTVESYLKSCDISESTLGKIKERILA